MRRSKFTLKPPSGCFERDLDRARSEFDITRRTGPRVEQHPRRALRRVLQRPVRGPAGAASADRDAHELLRGGGLARREQSSRRGTCHVFAGGTRQFISEARRELRDEPWIGCAYERTSRESVAALCRGEDRGLFARILAPRERRRRSRGQDRPRFAADHTRDRRADRRAVEPVDARERVRRDVASRPSERAVLRCRARRRSRFELAPRVTRHGARAGKLGVSSEHSEHVDGGERTQALETLASGSVVLPASRLHALCGVAASNARASLGASSTNANAASTNGRHRSSLARDARASDVADLPTVHLDESLQRARIDFGERIPRDSAVRRKCVDERIKRRELRGQGRRRSFRVRTRSSAPNRSNLIGGHGTRRVDA